MSKQFGFLIVKQTFSNGKQFIRNENLPVCADCLHFIRHKNNYPYDPIPNDKMYGKCKKFGQLDMVTGLIEHDYANECRLDDNRCGYKGSEYKDKRKP